MALYCLRRESTPVLELGFIKNYLKVDHTDDDELLTTLLLTAQQTVESHADLALTEQHWKYVISTDVVCDYRISRKCAEGRHWIQISTPLNPVRAVESVHKVVAGVGEDITAFKWIQHQEQSQICIPVSALGQAKSLEIVLAVGYSDPKTIPIFYLHAVLLTLSHFYQMRDAPSESRACDITPQVRQMLKHSVVYNRLV